jgi:hypothetical protein
MDEISKIMLVRSLKFKNVYSFDYGQKHPTFNIRRNELKENIHSEFSRLRNEIEKCVLENKPLILKIISNVHSFPYQLGKLIYVTTKLVNEDRIGVNELQTRMRKDKKYEKYVNLLIESGFAEYNEYKDVVATNKTKAILKDMTRKSESGKNDGNFIGDTVNEILYVIIKDNLDYVTNILQLRIIKSLINIVSCIYFFTKYLKMDELKEISLEKFYILYESLIEKTSKERIDNMLTRLTYSGIIRMAPSERNFRLTAYL